MHTLAGAPPQHAPVPVPYSQPLCNIRQGRYICRDDLLALEAHSPTPQPQLPPQLVQITTPLHRRAWEDALSRHPDQAFARCIVQGLHRGFRIGPKSSPSRQKAKRNLRSAYEHPEIIDKYLARELQLGRVIKLHPSNAYHLPGFQISPIGVIRKHNHPNKWRLIVDLSAPEGRSVNDELVPELCSLKYSLINEAVTLIRNLGPGALMAKVDLRGAYRVVPVHPEDRPRLGMKWKDSIFLDAALPFGLHSAPKIFSAVADGLLWLLHSKGAVHSIHYLDDFLLLGPAGSPACAVALQEFLALCSHLGVPVTEEITEGPASTVTFLGIELDTVANQLRLPEDKRRELAELHHWMIGQPSPLLRRSGTKRDLLSLIGLLNHAASVVKPGRTFLRSLIDVSCSVKALDHHVHLRSKARADIVWWYTFLESWNGVSLLPAAKPSQVILLDASAVWGCGATWSGHWF